MSTLTVTAHVTAGTDILRAATEAIRLATALGVAVRFEFNGTTCTVGPRVDPAVLVEAFHRARDAKMPFAFAL